MDKILEQHEDMIDKHEDRLDRIQTDLTDIKVRLGIKDKTNGQVVKYQEQLVENQRIEINERKEHDAQLRQDLAKLDERLWLVVTGILIMIVFDVLVILLGGIK